MLHNVGATQCRVIRELLFFKLISLQTIPLNPRRCTIWELNVAKSGTHPWNHQNKPCKSMVFGDVLHDGLVICSLWHSVEQARVLRELRIHTAVVFALMWFICLLCCQLVLSRQQSTLHPRSRDYVAPWMVLSVTPFQTLYHGKILNFLLFYLMCI